MDRKRGVIIGFIILIGVLALIFYYSINAKNNSFTGFIDEVVPEKIISLNEEILSIGQEITLNIQGEIKFSKESKEYSMRPIELSDNKISLRLNDRTINLVAGREKRVDFDNDGIYDISLSLISSNSEDAKIFLITISEEVGMLDSFYNKMGSFDSSLRKQSLIIMAIIFIIVVLILYYLFKVYFVPKIKINRARERKSQSELLRDLYEEIKESKNQNTKNEIYARARNLYKYMNGSEREEAESIMKKIENYIK